jgi:hypothetical protein
VGWADYRWGSDAAGGWEKRLRFNLSARFEERVQLSLAPSYTLSYDVAQYVTRVSDPLAEATYGTRYVFAGLDRTTLSVQTRLNFTFSPTLSFELYVEPFISTGDYGTLKEFQAPETYKFVEYGKEMGTLAALGEGRFDVDPDGPGPAASFRVSNEDFSYRSLLGNAVVRWEWRPGSTVFFVWQQTRINSIAGQGPTGDGEGVGRFDLAGDTQDMFGVRPDNIFMIKVSYWLNP